MNDLTQKYILKKIAKNTLPDNIVNAPKMGSPTDIVDWIRTPEFISVLTKLVSRKESFSKNFLAYDYVIKIISEHEKTPQFSHLCWCLFSMERWYQNSF
jgi:asparagine synthetase B (glutamine-hydrolysing)